LDRDCEKLARNPRPSAGFNARNGLNVNIKAAERYIKF